MYMVMAIYQCVNLSNNGLCESSLSKTENELDVDFNVDMMKINSHLLFTKADSQVVPQVGKLITDYNSMDN